MVLQNLRDELADSRNSKLSISPGALASLDRSFIVKDDRVCVQHVLRRSGRDGLSGAELGYDG